MCCCGKPTVNGTPGYKWQPNDTPIIRPVHPPTLGEGDNLLYDEPGRCSEHTDAHSHHYRLTQWHLLVCHGGGEERIIINSKEILPILANLDSNGRYWLFSSIYRAYSEGERKAQDKERLKWTRAAAEKRIKTRKLRNSVAVKVWIESKPDLSEATV